MKKNVVKAMSVGLSAITIASTLSVPVLADELDPQQSTANAGQATPAPEQAAPAAEQQVSTTPVTNDIKAVADDIKAVAAEIAPISTETPVTPAPATDTSEGTGVENQGGSEVITEGGNIESAEPAENNPVAPTESQVNQNLQKASEDLLVLADGVEAKEVKVEENEADVEGELTDREKSDETAKEKEVIGTVDVENANEVAEQAKKKAVESEAIAAQSANDADLAAAKALNTATQEDIDAAKEACDKAQTNVTQAQQDADDAKAAVKDAVDKLNEVLAENGLKVVYTDINEETGEETEKIVSEITKDQLDLLKEALRTADGKEVNDEIFMSLDGAAKKAIVDAYNALVSAQSESADAAEKLKEAKGKLSEIESSYEYKIAAILYDENSTPEAKSEAIVKLSFESHYKAIVDSIDIKKDADGNYLFYVVNYRCKDENGKDIKNKDGSYKTEPKNIRIVVSDEGVSLSEVTVTNIPEHYENSKHKTVEENSNTKIVTIGDNDYYAFDKSKGTVVKDEEVNEIPKDATNVEKGESTYSYGKYITGYKTKTSSSNSTYYEFDETKSRVKSLIKDGYDVTIETYDKKGNFLGEYTVTGDEKNLQKYLPGQGSVYRYVVLFKKETKTPIYSKTNAVIETVTTTYTDTKTEVETFSSDKKIKQKEYEQKVAEYKKAYPEEKGYVVTVEQYNKNKKSYKVTIKQTKTETVTTKTAYAAEQLTYVEATTNYTYSELQFVDKETTETAKENHSTAISDCKTAEGNVGKAAEKVEKTRGVVPKVIDAVKRVLDLTAASNIKDSNLDTIKDVLNRANSNYTAAVAKKAANDAAANAGTTLSLIISGEPVKYPSVTTTATVEEADEEVIPDDAVPAAGQTRTTRTRRTAANNAVAEEETTTIDDAETPLAGGDADDAVVEDTEDTTTVEEDLVPLAGEAQKGFFARTWWGWLLLIIAVLTGTTAYAKKKADAKKIK